METKAFGKEIRRYSVIGSTNEEAIRRARQGGAEGEIFIADQQTAGRGRMGRSWESPRGKNIYISFLLRPVLAPTRAPLITLAAGVALHEALSSFIKKKSLADLKIKWPNDLYLHDKKTAGILTEMEMKKEEIDFVVCGIGINVNSDPADFSPEVQKIATSLKSEIGKAIDREEILRNLIGTFEKRYRQLCQRGPEEIIAFCNDHSYLRGKRVRCESPTETVRGVACGLNEEGHLLVRTDRGETVPLVAGDILLEVS